MSSGMNMIGEALYELSLRECTNSKCGSPLYSSNW